MKLLNALGFGRASPDPEPIVLHPDCMKVHSTLVGLSLNGVKFDALNPKTGEWEKCPKPIFDPEISYRVSGERPAVVKNATFAANYGSPAPVAPATTPTLLKRGDVWASNNGYSFLVLGNKYDLVPNYNPANDPDTTPIVVMRDDIGVKQAVSCRDFNGNRADHNSKFCLLSKNASKSRNLNAPTIGSDYILLYRRNGATDVYLCKRTGEVKLR